MLSNNSRTFVKRGRSSTAAIVEELQANAIPDAQTADALWKLVDKNGDGMLSRAEFAHAIAVIKKQTAEGLAARLALEQGLDQSKRRTKVLFVLVMILVPVLAILLAGNAGLIYTVLEATKESKTSNPYPTPQTQKSQPPVLTTPDGNAVATVTPKSNINLADLPSLNIDYNSIHTISFATTHQLNTSNKTYEAVRGFKVEAYVWYNRKSMDWILTNGAIVSIRNRTVSFLRETVPQTGNLTVVPGSEEATSRRNRALEVRDLQFNNPPSSPAGGDGEGGFDPPGCETAGCQIMACVCPDDAVSCGGGGGGGGGGGAAGVGRRMTYELWDEAAEAGQLSEVDAASWRSVRAQFPVHTSDEDARRILGESVRKLYMEVCDGYLLEQAQPAPGGLLHPELTHMDVAEDFNKFVPKSWRKYECEACEAIVNWLERHGVDAICDALTSPESPIDEILGQISCDWIPGGILLSPVCDWLLSKILGWLCHEIIKEVIKKLIEEYGGNGDDLAGCVCEGLGMCPPGTCERPMDDGVDGIDDAVDETGKAAKCWRKCTKYCRDLHDRFDRDLCDACHIRCLHKEGILKDGVKDLL